LPENASLHFMGDRPYLPDTILLDVLIAPLPAERCMESEVAQTLIDVGLAQLVPLLGVTAHWEQELGIEAQQRIGFWRALLHRPSWIFMHDATSALDAAPRVAASPHYGSRAMMPLSHARRRWVRAGLLVLLIGSLLSSSIFGMRAYRTLLLLQSARELGVVETSAIRAWMTLRYVADSHNVDIEALTGRLQLQTSVDPNSTLRALAERDGQTPFAYVRNVQEAIAQIVASRPRAVMTQDDNAGWFAATSDRFLSAVLVYGYPALGLTLFLGAIGAPVPTGIATAIAGSLASLGHLSWIWSIALVVASSVLGDSVGYGLGRLVNEQFLARRGRWFGYTDANRRRIETLFTRWGGATILLTRTLVSHLSSIVSVLAGVNRFPLTRFLLYASLGRLVWTLAYFGLGAAVGTDFEGASGFLGNVSVCIIALAAAIATAAGLLHNLSSLGRSRPG
jgi:membrane protein DedA with SNARE-associated domain